jgi:hypothetical protein
VIVIILGIVLFILLIIPFIGLIGSNIEGSTISPSKCDINNPPPAPPPKTSGD